MGSRHRMRTGSNLSIHAKAARNRHESRSGACGRHVQERRATRAQTVRDVAPQHLPPAHEMPKNERSRAGCATDRADCGEECVRRDAGIVGARGVQRCLARAADVPAAACRHTADRVACVLERSAQRASRRLREEDRCDAARRSRRRIGCGRARVARRRQRTARPKPVRTMRARKSAPARTAPDRATARGRSAARRSAGR